MAVINKAAVADRKLEEEDTNRIRGT